MSTTERQPLTRDRIAEAALDRIDADGLEALTMRKLGAALGVEAMSLYNHVASKDDVLAAVADLLSGRVSEHFHAHTTGEWRDDARALAMAWWTVGVAHPHAFTLIADNVYDSPSAIQKMADVYSVFANTGLDMGQVSDAFHTAASYVVGAVRQELTVLEALRNGAGFVEGALPDGFEWLVDFKAACVATPGEVQFLRGLDIVLTGIDALLD
jgi:AcrR family transcriptional regulator